MKYQILEFNNN